MGCTYDEERRHEYRLICRKFFERWIIGNPGNRWEDIINMNTIKRDIKSRPFME
jgi:hypothetical protein